MPHAGEQGLARAGCLTRTPPTLWGVGRCSGTPFLDPEDMVLIETRSLSELCAHTVGSTGPCLGGWLAQCHGLSQSVSHTKPDQTGLASCLRFLPRGFAGGRRSSRSRPSASWAAGSSAQAESAGPACSPACLVHRHASLGCSAWKYGGGASAEQCKTGAGREVHVSSPTVYCWAMDSFTQLLWRHHLDWVSSEPQPVLPPPDLTPSVPSLLLPWGRTCQEAAGIQAFASGSVFRESWLRHKPVLLILMGNSSSSSSSRFTFAASSNSCCFQKC